MPQKYLHRPGVHVRHDWQRWIRPDFARWLKPGVDPADVIRGWRSSAPRSGRRSGTSVRINGRLIEVTPAQEAELQAVQARADGAITRVRELEPNWKPTPSAYESVDGLIKKYRADAQQAQERASELGRLDSDQGHLPESRFLHAGRAGTLRPRNAVKSIASDMRPDATHAAPLIQKQHRETSLLIINRRAH
jgi:hypothetical protein